MIYHFRLKIQQVFGHATQEIVPGTTLCISDAENKCRLCPLEINNLLQTPKNDK